MTKTEDPQGTWALPSPFIPEFTDQKHRMSSQQNERKVCLNETIDCCCFKVIIMKRKSLHKFCLHTINNCS